MSLPDPKKFASLLDSLFAEIGPREAEPLEGQALKEVWTETFREFSEFVWEAARTDEVRNISLGTLCAWLYGIEDDEGEPEENTNR
jgi:hypothetical protein